MSRKPRYYIVHTVHEIFRVVPEFRFPIPRYILCYIAENRLLLGQCGVQVSTVKRLIGDYALLNYGFLLNRLKTVNLRIRYIPVSYQLAYLHIIRHLSRSVGLKVE